MWVELLQFTSLLSSSVITTSLILTGFFVRIFWIRFRTGRRSTSCLNPRYQVVSIAGDAQSSNRDIELRIFAEDTTFVTIKLDCFASGGALLRRYRSCVGRSDHRLILANGTGLDLERSLVAQGICNGYSLHALRPTIAHAADGAAGVGQGTETPAEKSRVEQLKNFSSCERMSKESHVQDRFELIITAEHEADAIKEASDETVTLQIEEDFVVLSVHGREADYVLQRRVGGRKASQSGTLPVGFKPCQERCTVSVKPEERIRVVLRPYPEKWLAMGTRVKLDGLTKAQNLNGCSGTISAYFEANGKSSPERYEVRLDDPCPDGSCCKRIKRCNLVEEPKNTGLVADIV